MRGLAVGLALLAAAPAAAQAPATDPAMKGFNRPIPALYWARLSAIIARRMPSFPKGLSAQVRVHLDETGAVTYADFIRHSGVDVFDRILERTLAEFAVTAAERLPVATDPALKASAMAEGVTLVIRSRQADAPAETKRLNIPNSLKKTPKIKLPE